jgi:hypothetical protein
MNNAHIFGLFKNFDTVSDVIREVRAANLPSLNLDDITIQSPIEHPEAEDLLGPRSSHTRRYTLAGALLGASIGFSLIAAAQGNFFSQLKGGKPIIPLPPDFVLTYEMLILGGVYITVLGFLICAGLPTRMKSSLYDVKISEDQVAIVVKANVRCSAEIKKIFQKHGVLKIQEEAV